MQTLLPWTSFNCATHFMMVRREAGTKRSHAIVREFRNLERFNWFVISESYMTYFGSESSLEDAKNAAELKLKELGYKSVNPEFELMI